MKKAICIAFLLGSISAWAGGAGGGVPTPFDVKTVKFELADQGVYELEGRIELRQLKVTEVSKKTKLKKVTVITAPYLVIDLKDYPMLANKARTEDAAYPIINRTSDWREFRGRKVRLTVVAHMLIDNDDEGVPSLPAIYLDMVGRELLSR